LLLREVDKRTGISERLARCFRDYRKQERIEHPVGSMIRQRICGMALGYEDLNDHDRLRHDVVMGVLSEKDEPGGTGRVRKTDQGKPIAGKSTLNRLELTPEQASEKSRYKKIVADGAAIDELMVSVFIESYQSAPTEIVLDIDATDDPLHGHQEGRYFHGYYAEYCYLPLYIFCAEHLLCARLRTADEEPAGGVLAELYRDTVVRLAPVSVEEAEAMIGEVKGLAVIRGYRGLPRGDVRALAETVAALSRLALARGRPVVEAEINPVIVKRTGAVAVDGLVVLKG